MSRYRRGTVSGIEHSINSWVWYKRFPPEEGPWMDENREEWMELCERAAKEQDPEKLMLLIAQINRLLEAKERMLKGRPPATEPPK